MSDTQERHSVDIEEIKQTALRFKTTSYRRDLLHYRNLCVNEDIPNLCDALEAAESRITELEQELYNMKERWLFAEFGPDFRE